MYIKIYTKSQLILLRNLNRLIGKYEIPLEVLKAVEKILKAKTTGEEGFVAIILKPVTSDLAQLKDILDCYPQKLKIKEDVKQLEVLDTGTWMTKKKNWYQDCFELKGSKDRVYVLYSVRLKPYYEE